ncbi:MAG: hypothetical protein ACE14P_12755 [Methanotrichaceae archaeon]
MHKMLEPTGALLVGIIFICILLGISAGDVNKDPLGQIKNYHSNFVNHKQDFATGQLVLSKDTIYFPWAPRQQTSFDTSDIMPHLQPTKETILMNSSNPNVQLSDLKAMNSFKQRDVTYEGYQRKDQTSESFVNSMDAHVSGEQGKKELHSQEFNNDNIEKHVDDAVASGMNKAFGAGTIGADGVPGGKRAGNYMDIDVSGITVSAINTVAGGSAVATSNIIIKPVQVIIYPPEVEEKLK